MLSVSLEVLPASHVLCILLVTFVVYVLPYRPSVHTHLAYYTVSFSRVLMQP